MFKFTTLKKSPLTSSYFTSNFKLTKELCKANVDIFRDKKNICFIIFHPCLDNFV